MEYLAYSITTNIRELEGAMISLIAQSSLNKKSVTLDLAKQTLPTDYYIEPNNVEFFLEGMLQGRGDKPGAAAGVELDGQFGHVMPGDEQLLKPRQ